jgi:cubilin
MMFPTSGRTFCLLFVCLVLHSSLVVSGQQCGGNIVDPSGDGFYLTDYLANKTCTWQFQLKADKQLYIIVEELLMQDGDVLAFYNGSALNENLVVNYTLNLAPFAVVLFSRNSSIVFHAGPQNPKDPKAKHLSVKYNVSACAYTVSSASALVSSPSFPVTAGHSLNCTIHVTSPKPDDILVWGFENLEVIKGSLRIWDGDVKNDTKLLANYQDGSTDGADIFASGSSLLVEVFLSTIMKQKGFQAAYTAPTAACSETLDITMATQVTSPGYPGNYPGNLDCHWLITSPEGTTLRVTVDDAHFADIFDQVRIVDGDSRNDPAMMTLTKGTALDQVDFLLTSGNKLWLQFVSDQGLPGKGFKLTVTPYENGGGYRDSGKVIIGNNTASEDWENAGNTTQNVTATAYYYQIQVPDNQQVMLIPDDTFMFPSAALEFYDGWSVNSTLLTSFTSDITFYPVISSSNRMLIVACNFTSRQYFTADFLPMEKEGQYMMLTGVDGSLHLDYSDTMEDEITWLIPNSHKNSVVALRISHLDLETDERVTIHQGASQYDLVIAELTPEGTTDIPVIYLTKARVTYKKTSVNGTVSNAGSNRTILEATYTIKPVCQSSLAALVTKSDALTTPYYPDRYPLNSQCEWDFPAVSDATILRLSFDAFQVYNQHSVTVQRDDTTVVTVGNTTSHIVNTTTVLQATGLAVPDDVILTLHNTSMARVLFSSLFNGDTKDVSVGQGFKASYEYLSCGGLIVDSKQTLSTPGYPAPVKSNMTCVWLISLPKGRNTTVNIVKYQTQLQHVTSKNGTINTVEIHDGGSQHASLLPVQMSDGKSPSYNMSRSNLLWVRYTFQTPVQSTAVGAAFQV